MEVRINTVTQRANHAKAEIHSKYIFMKWLTVYNFDDLKYSKLHVTPDEMPNTLNFRFYSVPLNTFCIIEYF